MATNTQRIAALVLALVVILIGTPASAHHGSYASANDARVAALEDRVEALDATVASLDARLDALEAPAPSPSPTPAPTPTPTPAPTPSPTPPPIPGTVYTLPGSIDVSGATVNGPAIQAWLNGLPNGTAANPTNAVFPETGTGLLAAGGAIQLNGRSYLYLWGKNPSLVTGPVSGVEAGAGFRFKNQGNGSSHLNSPIVIGLFSNGASHHVKVMGFELEGTHPYRGADLAQVTMQSACGIHSYGNSSSPNHDIEIGYNYIHDVGGHALYWRGDNNLPYGLNFHHNVTRFTGTMGVALTNGTDLKVEDNRIEDVGINPIDFEDEVYEGANPTAIGSAIGRYVNVSIRRNRIDRWGYDEFFQPEAAIYRTSPGYPMTDVFIEDNDFYGGWQSWVYPSNPAGRMPMSSIGVISFYRGTSSNVQIRRNRALFPLEGRFIYLQAVTGYVAADNSMVDLTGPNPNGTYTLVGDVLYATGSTGTEAGSVIN